MFGFFFKQKTAYEMRISDWSSDVFSSDLRLAARRSARRRQELARVAHVFDVQQDRAGVAVDGEMVEQVGEVDVERVADRNHRREPDVARARSEEHTSELQSPMRISYAVFCLKKKHKNNTIYYQHPINY